MPWHRGAVEHRKSGYLLQLCPQVLRQVECSAQRFVSMLGHVTPPTVQRRVQEHVGAAGAREKALQQNNRQTAMKPRRR